MDPNKKSIQEQLNEYAKAGANSDSFRKLFEKLENSMNDAAESLPNRESNSENSMADYKIKRAKARKKKRKTGGRR